MRNLFLLGVVLVTGLVLGTEANENLEFNVTELDRIEELEYGFSKSSSNFNPLMVGLTLIRGAGAKGAGILSLCFTSIHFVYHIFSPMAFSDLIRVSFFFNQSFILHKLNADALMYLR